ncbi:MAG TPA: acylphosphatase [Nitrososphaerales archaeon]|nr:acylphosphatase [Nitrososphaerales archaeon]
MPDDLVAFDIIISGKVQGVYFRASMKIIADSNNVRGWVRNLEEGRVEALIQGRKPDVDEILNWCRTGPTKARVDKVAITELKADPSLRNFAIVV